MRRLTVLALLMVPVLGAPLAGAQAAEDRYVVVNGEGAVSAPPDMAEVATGVQARAPTARAALDQANAAMSRVIDAVKKAGIAEKDFKTARVGLSPVYDRPERGDARRLSGYQASNSLAIRVRDMTAIGTLLDSLVTAGANDIGGIRFLISEPKALMDEARKKAMEDAAARARLLAEAAGLQLGVVQRIEEGGVQVPRPLMMAPSDVAMRASAVPVAAGEQEVRVVLTVRFGLE